MCAVVTLAPPGCREADVGTDLFITVCLQRFVFFYSLSHPVSLQGKKSSKRPEESKMEGHVR